MCVGVCSVCRQFNPDSLLSGLVMDSFWVRSVSSQRRTTAQLIPYVERRDAWRERLLVLCTLRHLFMFSFVSVGLHVGGSLESILSGKLVGVTVTDFCRAVVTPK
jgi:hypothetical protein